MGRRWLQIIDECNNLAEDNMLEGLFQWFVDVAENIPFLHGGEGKTQGIPNE